MLAVSRDMLKRNIYNDYMKRLEKIIIPKALEYLHEELDRHIKQDSKYIYKQITKNVKSSFQLLKIRLAFLYYLNREEEYMKEWGNDIIIAHDKITYNKITISDIIKSNYIILSEDYLLNNNYKEKVNEFKVNVAEKECICIEFVPKEVISYLNNNFSELRIVTIKSDFGRSEYLKFKKRKQKVQILGEDFYIVYFTNEEEAKDVLKILFDVQYKKRQKISCSAHSNNELLYEDIIISKRIEDFEYNIGLINDPYLISPFKKNCDKLIKSLDYDLNRVIELLKKEHNFDELVEWVSKNAMFKEENKEYKKKVIETYTDLIENYLELLEQEHKQIICLDKIENDESKLQLDEAAVDKVDSDVDSDKLQVSVDGSNLVKEIEENKIEENQEK